MSEFSRETLLNIIETDHVQCGEASALARQALAAMDSEPVAVVEPSDYVTAAQLVGEGPARKAVHELYEGALRIGDKLYRHAQPAQTGVDDDVRNIIGLLETNEWAEHCTETVLGSRLEAEITRLVGSAQPALVPDKMIYQDGVLFVLNNDMSSIERGTVAMRAWNACRAAMLQEKTVCTCPSGDGSLRCPCPMHPGNSPVIPDGLIAAVNRLLDSDGSRGCYSAIQCGDAHDEIERLLAAATQLPGSEPATVPGKWIPVSERMPGSQEWVIVFAKWANQQVLCWDDVQNRWTDFEDQSYYADMFTHWMPLPATPQEPKP